MNPVRSLLLPAALLTLAGCHRQETSTHAAPVLPTARVHVTTVHVTSAPAYTQVTGTVRAVQRAMLAAKVMGTISELPVSLGQSVQAGDLLVRISANEINAKVAQAKAQLNQVERDLKRERDLLTRNASTPDMVKSLEDRYAMTQAMVHEAETMLGYTTIRAPFAGTVSRKLVDAGDLAGPGQPLIEIQGTDAFEVAAGIPDSLAGHLSTGSTVQVDVPVAGVSFAGKVVELSTAADANAHTVPARIAIPAGTAVRGGQFARVQVPGPEATALYAPATAVSQFGQMERVFVVNDAKKAELRLVKTGATTGDRVEVLSGLNDGDQIITSVPTGLREGQPLEILP